MSNNKTVLIVEDDQKYKEILVKLLNAQGIKTEVASDGAEAIKKINNGPLVDLILLDLLMPKMSGWNFMYEIPKTKAKSVPIVILTNLTEYSVADTPVQLDFITKANVSTEEVVAKVKKHLQMV